MFGSIVKVEGPAWESIRERILESTPAFLRRNIRGRAPSEHLFHLFLAFLHDAGILDQPTPALAAVHGALRNSLAFVDKLLVGVGAPPLQMALAATNGRCFAATGCGSPLRYLVIEGITDCPVCQAKHDAGAGRNGRRTPHEGLRALVIESDRDVANRPGWHEVPDRSALIAGPDRAPQVLAL